MTKRKAEKLAREYLALYLKRHYLHSNGAPEIEIVRTYKNGGGYCVYAAHYCLWDKLLKVLVNYGDCSTAIIMEYKADDDYELIRKEEMEAERK